MGGGGGDGGYGERQDAENARKARARAAINVMFGVAPTEQFEAVPREGFWRTAPDGSAFFDQAAYDAAVAASPASQDMAGRAASNRAALDALYGKVREDAFAAGNRKLAEQRDEAERANRFELFARGLDGGSVDIDTNARLARRAQESALDLGAKADSARTQFRTNDENTRLTLLQAIESGMDEGSAVSSALTQMRNNADRAAAEAQGLSLGNLFADAGLLYEQGRRARGEQQGAADFAAMWAGRNRARGATLGGGANGTITRS